MLLAAKISVEVAMQNFTWAIRKFSVVRRFFLYRVSLKETFFLIAHVYYFLYILLFVILVIILEAATRGFS